VRVSNQGALLGGVLIEYAVFGVDRWLRRCQGVYEYTNDPLCLLRVNRASAEDSVVLSDGTSVRPGDPILNLHLWNEQILPIPHDGATVAWARQLHRAIDTSLRDLAEWLTQRPDLDDIIALRADMRLGTTEQIRQLARIAARYGFEAAANRNIETAGAIRRLGESFFLFLLILATNPEALRSDIFWRDHALVYLSRGALERRYGVVRNH